MEYTHTKHTVLVIGERFAAFANGQEVLTYLQLLEAIQQSSFLSRANHIVVGQGVTPRVLAEIRIALERANLTGDVTVEEYISARIAAEEVHKHRWQNVLITRPVPVVPDTFLAHLVLDDDSADIADHVTGIHIPGMVLVEAARQACIALSNYVGDKVGFDNKSSLHILQSV